MKANSSPPLSRLAACLAAAALLGLYGLALQASPAFGPAISVPIDLPRDTARKLPAPNIIDQSREAAALKSRGCLECHVGTDEHTMHKSPNVVLGCTDCHGGNATPGLLMRKAHIAPRHGEWWPGSANPNNSTILFNQESPEFIQFVNPGDLRVADKACGTCHRQEVASVGHSMMRHGAMLWGAALYNNGAIPQKSPLYGQAYAADGASPHEPHARHAGGHKEIWRPALPRPAAALRHQPAEQHPSHLREGRRAAEPARHPQRRRAAGQARAPTQRTRPRHAEPH